MQAVLAHAAEGADLPPADLADDFVQFRQSEFSFGRGNSNQGEWGETQHLAQGSLGDREIGQQRIPAANTGLARDRRATLTRPSATNERIPQLAENLVECPIHKKHERVGLPERVLHRLGAEQSRPMFANRTPLHLEVFDQPLLHELTLSKIPPNRFAPIGKLCARIVRAPQNPPLAPGISHSPRKEHHNVSCGINVRAMGKTAPGKGRESRTGFPPDSMTDSGFALMADRLPSSKGAVLLKPAS
jgi:hypothetical protein